VVLDVVAPGELELARAALERHRSAAMALLPAV
jgi:hypothetical protein